MGLLRCIADIRWWCHPNRKEDVNLDETLCSAGRVSSSFNLLILCLDDGGIECFDAAYDYLVIERSNISLLVYIFASILPNQVS